MGIGSFRFMMLLLTIATLAVNIYLFYIIPKGFFPEQDTGRMSGSIVGEQDTSFQAMEQRIVDLSKIVQADPGVADVMAFTGGGAGTTTNTGRMFVSLKPLNQRKSTAQQIINRLRPKLAVVPGATLYLQAVQDVRIGGRMSAAEYQYTIQDDNLTELDQWGPRLLTLLKKLPQLRDVNSDQQNSGLEANLVIDRQTAARVGLTPQTIDSILYDAFGEREIATTYTSLNQYFVVMEVAPEFWQNPDGLRQIYATATNGSQVPLATFTRFQEGTAALAVNHSGSFRR